MGANEDPKCLAQINEKVVVYIHKRSARQLEEPNWSTIGLRDELMILS